MASSTILETMQKKRRGFFPGAPRDDLPVSVASDGKAASGAGADHLIGLRRRMSSFSVHIQPISSATAEWAIRRTQSLPSIKEMAAGRLRRWWEWGVGWLMARRPPFARDLEMDEEESAALGCHARGTWRHVFHKLRAEVRKLLGRDGLPVTHNAFRYDSVSYAQNFDDADLAPRRREP